MLVTVDPSLPRSGHCALPRRLAEPGSVQSLLSAMPGWQVTIVFGRAWPVTLCWGAN